MFLSEMISPHYKMLGGKLKTKKKRSWCSFCHLAQLKMKTKLIVPVNVMRQKQDLLLNASLLSTKPPAAGLSVQYTLDNM